MCNVLQTLTIWAAYFDFNVCLLVGWVGGWLTYSVCEEGEGMREGEEKIPCRLCAECDLGLETTNGEIMT